jgi:hypothetical protein
MHLCFKRRIFFGLEDLCSHHNTSMKIYVDTFIAIIGMPVLLVCVGCMSAAFRTLLSGTLTLNVLIEFGVVSVGHFAFDPRCVTKG